MACRAGIPRFGAAVALTSIFCWLTKEVPSPPSPDAVNASGLFMHRSTAVSSGFWPVFVLISPASEGMLLLSVIYRCWGFSYGFSGGEVCARAGNSCGSCLCRWPGGSARDSSCFRDLTSVLKTCTISSLPEQTSDYCLLNHWFAASRNSVLGCSGLHAEVISENANQQRFRQCIFWFSSRLSEFFCWFAASLSRGSRRVLYSKHCFW